MQFREIFCCNKSCKFSLFNKEDPCKLLVCYLVLLISLDSVQLEFSLQYSTKNICSEKYYQKCMHQETTYLRAWSRALKLLQTTSGCKRYSQIKHPCHKIRFLLDHQQSNMLFGPHISRMPFNNNLIVIIITICSRKVRIYTNKLIPRNIILEMV